MSRHKALPEVYSPQEGGRRATAEYAGLTAFAHSLNLLRPPCLPARDKAFPRHSTSVSAFHFSYRLKNTAARGGSVTFRE